MAATIKLISGVLVMRQRSLTILPGIPVQSGASEHFFDERKKSCMENQLYLKYNKFEICKLLAHKPLSVEVVPFNDK